MRVIPLLCLSIMHPSLALVRPIHTILRPSIRLLSTPPSNRSPAQSWGDAKRSYSSTSSSRSRSGRRRGPQTPKTADARACDRSLIAPGLEVFVIQKEHQRDGQETVGTVERLLTSAAFHPRGIKVRLEDGVVGRVSRFTDGCFD
jgi:uncharacterized repeat protein (TIGR03833 family)